MKTAGRTDAGLHLPGSYCIQVAHMQDQCYNDVTGKVFLCGKGQAMFGKRKNQEKKEAKVISLPELGELKFDGIGWNAVNPVKLELWDKAYELSVTFRAEAEEEELTASQKEAFAKFKKLVIERKSDIEDMISQFLEGEDVEDIGERMVPREAEFSSRGECALYIEDMSGENGDDIFPGPALFLLPKLVMYAAEECSDFMGGFISIFDLEELYGENYQETESYAAHIKRERELEREVWESRVNNSSSNKK